MSRGIALPFNDLGASMGDGGQRQAPAAALPPRKRPGTHCTGGWVGPKWAGLDECRKSLQPPGFDPPDSPARSE
jgi:hypothetical protein